MKKQNIIKPIGLKGNESINRVRELMGMQPITESTSSNSVIELSKMGPDGKVYGIVREKHDYFIKVTDKTKNIVAEDFQYIGGLQNKKSEAYDTYAKAIKKLNLKFISINESMGKSGQVNVFANDNLITESDEKIHNPIDDAHAEYTSPSDRMYDSDEWVEAQKNASGDDSEELSEAEQAVEEMKDKEYGAEVVEAAKPTKSRLKIETAMESMDEIIGESDRIEKLAESISEADLERLIALKKKV